MLRFRRVAGYGTGSPRVRHRSIPHSACGAAQPRPHPIPGPIGPIGPIGPSEPPITDGQANVGGETVLPPPSVSRPLDMMGRDQGASGNTWSAISPDHDDT